MFERGLDPTSRRIPRLAITGPRARGERRKTIVERNANRPRKRGVRKTRLAFSSAGWATIHLESPVSGSDRHSVVRLRVNDGPAARPRGRGVRGRLFRWARAHDRSCGRSRTTTSRRNVQRRGKLERCPNRLGERGETLETESTSDLGSRWRSRGIEVTPRAWIVARPSAPCASVARRICTEPRDFSRNNASFARESRGAR